MAQVNMLEAKTNLSKLVEAVETGKETEIVLARNGKPVARIVPLRQPDVSKRLGIAEGEFEGFDFDAFEALDEVIWRGFYEDQAGAKPAPRKPARQKKSAR
jgi:prevent-host-death family protein